MKASDVISRGGVIAFDTRVERLIHTQAGWLVRYGGSASGELAVDDRGDVDERGRHAPMADS